MRKLLLSFISILIIAMPTMAQQVSETEALQEAKKFLGTAQKLSKRKVNAANRLALAYTSKSADKANFYVFNENDADGGYVFVAGDKRIEPIIGYAESGNFSEKDMPDNMRAWLKGYEMQLEELYSSDANADRVIRRVSSSKAAVAPLVTTQWNQREPFNGKCPTINGQKCVTGCVAVAWAQIMNLWQWPASLPAVESYTYTLNNATQTVDAFDGYSMNWNNLKSSYSKTDTDDDLASLLRFCGQAVHMIYRTSSSTANTGIIPQKLISMGYDPTARHVMRYSYGIDEWEDLIYKEVAEQRAVLYEGQSNDGGHAFICDGYDGNGFFHINWGWGGLSDGYFLLALLDPGNQGTGGSSGAYTNDQSALIGISHGQTSTPYSEYRMTAMDETLTSSNTLQYGFFNMTGQTMSFDCGIGYMSNDGSYQVITRTFRQRTDLDYLVGFVGTYTPMASDFPADGIYKVAPISRVVGTNTYYSGWPGNKYLYVEVRNGAIATCRMAPLENLTATAQGVEGSKLAGFAHKLKFNVKNNSDDEFIGSVYIWMKTPDDPQAYPVDKTETALYLRGGEAIDVTKTITLSAYYGAGTYTFYLSKDKNDMSSSNLLAQISVEITAVPTNVDFTNVSFKRVKFKGGKPFKAVVTVENNSNDPYPYPIAVYIYKGEIGASAYGVGVFEGNLDTPIAVGETRDVEVPIPNVLTEDAGITAKGRKYNKPGSYVEYGTGISEWANFCAVNIGSTGWATYASTYDLKFKECDDLKAYVGKLNAAKNQLTLAEKAETIIGGTGLVVNGTPNSIYAVRINPGNGIDFSSENDLVGVTQDVTLTPSSVFVLGNVNNTVGFYIYGGTTMKAGHAYLPKSLVSADAPSVSMVLNDATAISNVTVEDNRSDANIYNVAGQKVGADYKGIVIINGKKVLKK
ncbi:MAG: C10 family peptidase [Bacteroidaceae bacterium]|nr:C10 family peptidase [Bacteroidaceae bacterium]